MGRRSFLTARRATVNSYAPPRTPGLLYEVASAKVCAQPEYVNDPRGNLLRRSARRVRGGEAVERRDLVRPTDHAQVGAVQGEGLGRARRVRPGRSEEHTSELQSQSNLVCRLLLEKKKKELGRTSPVTS